MLLFHFLIIKELLSQSNQNNNQAILSRNNNNNKSAKSIKINSYKSSTHKTTKKRKYNTT